jgi:hypothetical protein
MILTATLGSELAASLCDGSGDARGRSIGIGVDGLRQWLLHSDVAREDQPCPDPDSTWGSVDGSHEVLVGPQKARQGANLREIRSQVGREAGVGQGVGHRPLVDDFQLALVGRLLDSPANLVRKVVAELLVGAGERRHEQSLLRELLAPLSTKWVPHRGDCRQEQDRGAQSSRQASEDTQLHL